MAMKLSPDFTRSYQNLKNTFGSVVVPDFEAITNKHLPASIRSASDAITSGSVESSTRSSGYLASCLNVRANLSGQRDEPPIPQTITCLNWCRTSSANSDSSWTTPRISSATVNQPSEFLMILATDSSVVQTDASFATIRAAMFASCACWSAVSMRCANGSGNSSAEFMIQPRLLECARSV